MLHSFENSVNRLGRPGSSFGAGRSFVKKRMRHELKICQRLKQLEDAIARQRRLIGDLTSRNRNTERARAHLRDLLLDLDRVLRSGAESKAA